MPKKIVTIVGARPQFVKAFPFHRQIKKNQTFQEIIIHTGQHYDFEMSQLFFEELQLPSPDYNLEIGSNTHGIQTGQMLMSLEKIISQEQPDYIMVYGDTNSTLAGALTAAKTCIPLIHVEAGLRSFNRNMPEEINRVVTDHIANILFCPTQQAVKNLIKEGFQLSQLSEVGCCITINDHLVFQVDDIMQEAVQQTLPFIENKQSLLANLNIQNKDYILVTAHRAENVDDKKRLKSLVDILNSLAEKTTVVFPIHPRTKQRLEDFSLEISPLVNVIKPVGYLSMIFLEKHARFIMTDSGGIQKEAFWLHVPCLTLRKETEWVETIHQGANHLVDLDKGKIESIIYEDREGTIKSENETTVNAAYQMLNILSRLSF